MLSLAFKLHPPNSVNKVTLFLLGWQTSVHAQGQQSYLSMFALVGSWREGLLALHCMQIASFEAHEIGGYLV